MKRAEIILTVLAVVAAFVAMLPFRRAHAQEGCTLETLRSAYIYATTGFYVLPDGLGIWASAGRLVSDATGGFTGTDTTSASGEIQRNRRYSGTYTINPECTGTMSFRDESGFRAGMDFVVTLDGSEVMFIQSDKNMILSGRARRQ